MTTTLSPVIAQIYGDGKPHEPVVQVIALKVSTTARLK